MIKRIHVYDIDGVLLSSLHRFRVTPETGRIDLDYWRRHDKNPEMIIKDSELPHAAQYRADLDNPDVYVIIATAREIRKYDANYYVVKRLGRGKMPNKFVYRNPGDDTKGAILKIEGIRPLLNLKQFREAEVHIWEDNPDYLNAMVAALNATGHFIYSAQGV